MDMDTVISTPNMTHPIVLPWLFFQLQTVCRRT